MVARLRVGLEQGMSMSGVNTLKIPPSRYVAGTQLNKTHGMCLARQTACCPHCVDCVREMPSLWEAGTQFLVAHKVTSGWFPR